MNLKDLKELSPEDKKEFLRLINKHLEFSDDLPWTVDPTVGDIKFYFEERLEERKKSKNNIQWPKELSKRETIICRLKMVQAMLICCPPIDDNANILKKACLMIGQSVIESILSWKAVPHPETSQLSMWPGLDPDAAEVINAVYHKVKEYFEYRFKFN